MEVLEGEDDLGDVEFGAGLGKKVHLFRKSVLFAQEAKQLTPRTVLKGEKQFLVVLEGVV